MRFSLLSLLLAWWLLVAPLASAQAVPNGPVYLPFVAGPTAPPSPFGFDVRTYAPASTLDYVVAAQARWARVGDVLWATVEPERGTYRWEALAALEANMARLRSVNPSIEPTVVLTSTPVWAQSIAGRACSPPRPEHYAALARFAQEAARRYASGPLAISHWEIWNEPDVAASDVRDSDGMGCWLDKANPRAGGVAYGELLKVVYPAIKAGNPNASVMAGALLYNWPNDTDSRAFLEGFLSTGAPFDVLSFHAYGVWGANDLLVSKTNRLRSIMQAYGMGNKPLMATEVAAMCYGNSVASCQPSFEEWKRRQANYAARIYAQALALKLEGAFWYTLSSNGPGYQFSHLLDEQNGTVVPREAYYAFVNSARLLQGARYVGLPPADLPADRLDDVQELLFRKSGSTLRVLWVPQIDWPSGAYNIQVPAGARAVCVQRLELQQPYRFDCSDTNNNGIISLAINSFPQYIEIFD